MPKHITIRVLAIASAGGHWVQLRRLRPAWEGCHVIYVSTSMVRRDEIVIESKKQGDVSPAFYAVVDASRWEKIKLLRQFFQIASIVLKERPNVIVSTGAAPGFFALKFGKLLGARTIWLDSLANAENLSLSGEKVATCADLWLTQWEHLARKDRKGKQLRYVGSVI